MTLAAGLFGSPGPSPSGDVVAFGDLDGDGWWDLIRSGRFGPAAWRNTGAGSFVPATESLGLEGARAENTVLPVDLDGDGRVELLTLSYGAAELHRTTGARFVRAEGALPSMSMARAVSAAAADVNGDGDLDLFIAQHPTFEQVGFLLANSGDGTFRDVTVASGLGGTGTITLQAHFFDCDSDGDPDLALANDKGALTGFVTQIYRNEGGRFADVTAGAGTGPTIDGMGISSGDVDGDGHLDLYVSNSPNVPAIGIGNLLLRNRGDCTFEEVSRQLGVEAIHIGWGTAMLDIDNDGDLDLLAAGDGHDGPRGTRLFENLRHEGFRDITEAAGLLDDGDAYGVSVADYDGDGFVDIALAHSLYGAPVRLFRNLGNANASVRVRLLGPPTNRHGIGARLIATIGDRTLVRTIDAGTGFGGANPPEAHFGLGPATQIDRLEVHWPHGPTTSAFALPPGVTLHSVAD